MSCPREPTWVAYVDGEIPPDEVRAVESHLIGCERCRGLVLALRTENGLLADILQERPLLAQERLYARAEDLTEVDGRGLAFGLPLALAGAAAVAAVLGLLFDTRLPSGASWLSPTRLFGANEMFFDLFFALRNRAPGLLEFGLSVAAMVSLAALVTFVATALLRRMSGPTALGLLAFVLLMPSEPARAGVVIHHEGLILARGETVEGTVFAHGDTVRIDGVINGNLVAFAEHLEVRGTVTGMLLGMARETTVSGTVEGTLIMGGEDVHLEGEAKGVALVAGDRVSIEEEARVKDDLVTFGADVVFEGHVGRDFIDMSEKVRVLGEVGRDATLFVERGRVEEGANVAGRLEWHTWNPENVSVDEGARIGGGVTTHITEHDRHGYWSRYSNPRFYFWILVRVAAAFAVGLLAYALFPKLFAGAVPDGRSFFVSLGKGFVVLLVTPVMIVVSALTLIGMPVALIGAGLLLGAIYLSGILVAALIGASLTRPSHESLRDFGVALTAGLAVLAVGTLIPGLGVLLHVIVVMVGLGLLVDRTTALWRRARTRV